MEYRDVGARKGEIATNIISEIVKPGHQIDFEKWSKQINGVVSQQIGFIGLDILRPRDKNHLEYIIIIRFENHECLKAWLTSETFRRIFARAQPFLISHRSQQQSGGLEQWFELPAHDHQIDQLKKPAFYKLIITGILAVYPLVLLANYLLVYFIKKLPYPIYTLVSVIFISTLMTYPMMPFISKILRPWLYPSRTS